MATSISPLGKDRVGGKKWSSLSLSFSLSSRSVDSKPLFLLLLFSTFGFSLKFPFLNKGNIYLSRRGRVGGARAAPWGGKGARRTINVIPASSSLEFPDFREIKEGRGGEEIKESRAGGNSFEERFPNILNQDRFPDLLVQPDQICSPLKVESFFVFRPSVSTTTREGKERKLGRSEKLKKAASS